MSLYDLLLPLSKFWKPKNIRISNNVFSLHGKFTVGLLVISSLVVSIKEYFGVPITCMIDDKTKKDYAEYYCWIHGTYILKKYLNGTIGKRIAARGVGETFGVETESDRIYQRYYQWITFVLLLLAVLLHIPTFLWKLWECQRMKTICKDFGSPMVSPNWNEIESIRIVKYLRQKNYKTLHRVYAYRFLFCEILNFIAVIGTIWILDLIFDDFWIEYGKAVKAMFSMDTSAWAISTSRMFPKLAKCTYHTFGSSGTVQKFDALCLLSLNIINEKIFAIVWLWVVFLFITSSINIFYKIAIFSCTQIRMRILYSQCCRVKYSDIRLITKNGDFGQWFFLYQMNRNINPVIFQEILGELIKYDREDIVYKNHDETEETI